MATSKRDAVRGAQRQLQVSNPQLVPDGWWGQHTESTYTAAPSVVQKAAEKAVVDAGYTLAGVRMANVGQKGTWITHDKAASLAERAARMAGIDPAITLFYLNFEPAVRVINGQKEYNVESLSPNGLYRGLFQVGTPAWTDARAVFPEIGGPENWKDPWLNALAAAGFAKRNIAYAKELHNYNGPFTPEVMYAMHNQGHTFISSAQRGGMGKFAESQSASAKTILRTAAQTVQKA